MPTGKELARKRMEELRREGEAFAANPVPLKQQLGETIVFLANGLQAIGWLMVAALSAGMAYFLWLIYSAMSG
jgi:hypothetical protein